MTVRDRREKALPRILLPEAALALTFIQIDLELELALTTTFYTYVIKLL